LASYPFVKSILLDVLYVSGIIEKSFNRHKIPDNRIPQNVCPAENLGIHPLTRVHSLLDTNFEEDNDD